MSQAHFIFNAYRSSLYEHKHVYIQVKIRQYELLHVLENRYPSFIHHKVVNIWCCHFLHN